MRTFARDSNSRDFDPSVRLGVWVFIGICMYLVVLGLLGHIFTPGAGAPAPSISLALVPSAHCTHFTHLYNPSTAYTPTSLLTCCIFCNIRCSADSFEQSMKT